MQKRQLSSNIDVYHIKVVSHMPNYCSHHNTGIKMVIQLSNLKSGIKAIIQNYPDNSHEVMKLQALGILPGDQIEIMRRLPFGPISIKHCNNSFFALRRSYASKILVRLES